MQTSQTDPAALIAIHTIDSAPQKSKSALRGLMQRLGLAFLACTLIISVSGFARAGDTRDEAAIRSLGDWLKGANPSAPRPEWCVPCMTP